MTGNPDQVAQQVRWIRLRTLFGAFLANTLTLLYAYVAIALVGYAFNQIDPLLRLLPVAMASGPLGYFGLAIGFLEVFAPLLFTYVFLLVVLMLFLSILMLPLAMCWRAPRRGLILRPFRRKKTSRALKRLVRRYLTGVGHLYTLSDRDIRFPWLVRLPGMFSFALFQHRVTDSDRSISRLVGMVDRITIRNLNWMCSRSKVFTVDCPEKSWQAAVTNMIRKVDVVFIDLSHLGQGVIWEMDQCQLAGVADRVVFLAEHASETEALGYLRGRVDDPEKHLYLYDGRGVCSRKGDLITQVARITLLT